jgi:hypothetical protein
MQIKKIPKIPSRIEPATFRHVAQCLNQLRHRYPNKQHFSVHWISNWRPEDSATNDSKQSPTSLCSYFLHEWVFALLGLFSNVELFHPFKEFIAHQHVMILA